MKLSATSRSRLTILLIILTVTIWIGNFIQDISALIHYLDEHPSTKISRIFLMVLGDFTFEFLIIGTIIFYTKIFFDRIINAYMIKKNYSLTQLIEDGHFQKNDFKTKNDEVITKFYKQRKVIRFLKNL